MFRLFFSIKWLLFKVIWKTGEERFREIWSKVSEIIDYDDHRKTWTFDYVNCEEFKKLFEESELHDGIKSFLLSKEHLGRYTQEYTELRYVGGDLSWLIAKLLSDVIEILDLSRKVLKLKRHQERPKSSHSN